MKSTDTNFNDFSGIWKCGDDDSNIRFRISVHDNGQVAITAFDSSDGESFEVQDLVVEGTVVKFNLRVPSNGYTTTNVFDFSESKERILVTYCVQEVFVKESDA